MGAQRRARSGDNGGKLTPAGEVLAEVMQVLKRQTGFDRPSLPAVYTAREVKAFTHAPDGVDGERAEFTICGLIRPRTLDSFIAAPQPPAARFIVRCTTGWSKDF